MHKKAAMLEDRAVIRASGEDATSFLQGLLTNDIERLHPSEARYAALLTPQGKILFDMIVVRTPGVAMRCSACSLRMARAAIMTGSPISRTAESISARSR